MIATRRKRRLCLALAIVAGGTIGLVSNNVSANTVADANSTPNQGLVRQVPATAYYVTGNRQLYTLTDQALTPQRRADTQTTWTATAQVDFTNATGQVTRYLYVKNARTQAAGWMRSADLHPGKSFQVSAPKAVKARNYVVVKTFKSTQTPAHKIYRLVGKRAAMRWIAQKKLSHTKTYRVTKHRTYYQAGKAYTYLYVTSGKTKGWVYQRDLKRGTAYNVNRHRAAIKAKLQKYLTSVTRDKTAAVAFYNLTPIKGSRAARASHSVVYRQGKLAVSARGNHVTTSASTYKLYIAAYLMHLKQKHRFSWTKANRAGMTRMIVKSANDYPVSILQRYGRTPINHWLASQGYYGHPFSATRSSKTTANSLIKVLKDLQTGQRAFTNKRDRAFILSLMKRQVYRRGIPTGVARADKGTVVRDKVGFLNDNNGDAGIVTLPNGQRYLLVILTWGRGQYAFTGYPRIARIVEHVQKIVY